MKDSYYVYSSFDSEKELPRYSIECLVSIISLRRHTDRPVVVFTNNESFFCPFLKKNGGVIDEVVAMETVLSPKLLKIHSIKESSGRFVYLDTHTLVFDDVALLLEANDFKIAACAAPWRENVGAIKIGSVEHEISRRYSINTGVMLINNDGNTLDGLFSLWLEVYKNKLNSSTSKKIQDQPCFTEACLSYKPSLWLLPNNFNFRANIGGLLSGRLHIWHSHLFNEMESIYKDGLRYDDMCSLVDRVGVINENNTTCVFKPMRQNLLKAEMLVRE